MKIRQADPRDAVALSALAMETYAEAFGHSFSAPDLQGHLDDHLTADHFRTYCERDGLLVAEWDGVIVGFAQFGAAGTNSGCDAELRRLYVQAGFRNRGIGRSLMTAAFGHPLLRGANRVCLDVWEHNPAAMRFYRRFGFEVVGERRFAVRSGAETSLDLIMARPASTKSVVSQ